MDELQQVDPIQETRKGKELCMVIENIEIERFEESFIEPIGEPEDETEEIELVI